MTKAAIPEAALGARARADEPFVRRLLVVEDLALMRDLIATVFRGQGFDVATAGSAADARRIATTFDPDAAILDIDPGGGPNGVDLAHMLLRAHPYLAITFLTDAGDPRIAASHPLPDGATIAYLGKSGMTDLDRLIGAVEATLADASNARYRDDQADGRPFGRLTPAQLEVLALAAGGLSNAGIASVRGTNERTVERILQYVYEALGITADPQFNQRVVAIARFIEEGGQPLTPPARTAAGRR